MFCFVLLWLFFILGLDLAEAKLQTQNINRWLMFFGDNLAGRRTQWWDNVDHSVLRGYALCCICVGVVEQVLLVSGSLPCFMF